MRRGLAIAARSVAVLSFALPSFALPSIALPWFGCAGGAVVPLDAGPMDDAGRFEDAGPPPDCGDRSACGARCVDLASDPSNCGGCGRTCVVANAGAACVAGECAIAACTPGFFDRDGEVDNGCEVADRCVPDAACTTSCGSIGRVACDEGEASCALPEETCNLADDDCDGSCDEGALPGCRVGVHRAFGDGHLYTRDEGLASGAPFSIEIRDYFHLYAETREGLRPLFRCQKGNGRFLLTTDTACDMLGGQREVLGFISPINRCGTVRLHRLFHAATGNHFYTTDDAEQANLLAAGGWTAEPSPGFVWPAP